MEELQQWRAGYPDRGSPMRFENDNSPGRSNNHPECCAPDLTGGFPLDS
jgi:hypothetical protein